MTEPMTACWQAEDARIILANEALERNDAVFLATHSAVQGFDVRGTHASDVAAPTEQGLLDALSAPSTRHAFCVVEGEPGSGKSHLIRWLKVRWPEEESLPPLLIQRLDGSLQGTLQQLQRALPDEHQHLFDRIGRPQDLTLAGRARVFHSNLALALHPDHFANPPEDAAWCSQFKLAELIGDNALLDQWKAPERIMELLSGKKGKRDQELARFNLEDIADLEHLLRPLRTPTPKAVRFKNELKKEAQSIRQLSRQEILGPSAQEDLRRQFDYGYKLVDALNERHNNAVQNVLGIATDGLKELFLRLRRELRDRRLVLLLEDITAWEGVDRQLIDVLVTNVETRQEQDLCPMISVVGLTPAYFQNKSFQANYRQRITHQIGLGNASGANDYQDVFTLRTPKAQVAFAAKYLRATRAGIERLTEWDGGPTPVPNRCDPCPHRESCHTEFGADDGIGLYPFTAQAITTLYGILRDPQHTSTYQTPRGMLQGVLSPTLLHPTVLDAGDYPGAEIEPNLIPDDDRRLFGQIAEVLEARINDEPTRGRMRRLIAYWGQKDAATARTLVDEDGALSYGGIRQGIYQAFALPWLGSDSPDEPIPTNETTSTPPSTHATETPKPSASTASRARATGSRDPAKPATTKPSPGQRRMSNTQMLNVRQDIARWGEGKKPERPAELNRLAAEIVDRLNWGHLGISPWVRLKLFTPDTIILRDTKPARLQHFVLERDQWVKKGIEAYQAMRTGDVGVDPQEMESHRRAYASMQRKLGPAISQKVRDRLPSLETGKTWDIVASALQILLARAWLRGNVSPTAPTWQQWQVAISDEGDPLSNPRDRIDSWNDLVNATKGIQCVLRTVLRQWLTLPQYQADPEHHNPETSLALISNGLVDGLLTLRDTFSVAPLPASTQGLGDKLQELQRLSEVVREVNQRLRNIPRFEVERLSKLAEAVERMSRLSSLREHIKRVDGVVEDIAAQFPNNVAKSAQDWRTAKQNLKAQGFLDTRADNPGTAVETFMDRVADNDVPSTENRAQALSWTLDAPASALLSVHSGFDTAEKTIAQMLEYVEEFLEGTVEAGGSLEDIHQAGARIQGAAERAIAGLESKHDD